MTVTGDIREERRVVTALFADLVGSTALGERLDPEDFKLIVSDAVARMVTCVEAFGGLVKDLAGDGVLAIFGAPVAHEDDPERAIRAGLRIVGEIDEFARELEGGWGIEGFGVRVGIDTGPVVVGAIGAGDRVEFAALGDAVNIAARLQSHATPGSVLVGEETHRLAEPMFGWEPPVSLDLRGKSQPVMARAVSAALAHGPATRARGLEGAQAQMVGRERELADGRRALNAVLEGSGGILYLVGEPGIGKTRLLGELRSDFTSAGAPHGEPLWIEGRCVSYGESMPYWPFRDLLRTWLGAAIDQPELRLRVALRRHVERLFGGRSADVEPYLGQLLGLTLEPEAAARLSELSPEALQYRTFEVVRTLLRRLAEGGPVVVALEDLHWADASSLQLLERLQADTETAALLLIITMRPERDHASWHVKEVAARDLPHRVTEISLEALSGDAGRELLHALIGAGTLPPEMERGILEPAEGNPFFLEELVRSLVDAGALEHEADGWRFDHGVAVEIPPNVEKVILSRIDLLSPSARVALLAASVLGRQFGLPLLEALTKQDGEATRSALIELQRVDLLREGRRWPEPEYRFKHVLIQETAYRTLVKDDRERMHRTAAQWLEERYSGREDEVAGLLAHHWLGAADEEQAVAYLTKAGDRARQAYALDEAIGHYRELLAILEARGERRVMALVLFKLALALHMSLRFAEANEAYQRAFGLWTAPSPPEPATSVLRVSSSVLPDDPDPHSAIAWPNIQLCMQLFDRLVEQWEERTIVPNLAERWEIADDGLRYVFHLREGLTWSDGTPLTAHDVEFGIKRVLDPDAPGSSVAIYFVLENGREQYLGRNRDPGAVGVRALDARTVEFRLVAPAPYFMSVMNRPDGGPQPQHAIAAHGDAWTETGRQVVSGPFAIAERDAARLVLERRADYRGPRVGNVRRVEMTRDQVPGAIERYGRGELDLVMVRYTPRAADLVDRGGPDAVTGPAAWSGYLAFDHANPAVGDVDLRIALARAIDRDALAATMPANLVIATGGVVPPALQGHTPDIALRYDPDLARAHLAQSGFEGSLAVASLDADRVLIEPVASSWRDVLGVPVEIRSWTWDMLPSMGDPREVAPIIFTGWLPGYADPEYILRLLFQTDSKTNEGRFSWPPFDELIERARQERSDRGRLELFHEADRMVVTERVACIPLVYGRSMAIVRPRVHGWREFGKTSANFADLTVDPQDAGRRPTD